MGDEHPLVRTLDQAFDARSWHGTNLRGAVRGLSAVEASWRPSPDRHSIWDLVLHCAYWKYVVHRRLVGGKRGGFPRAGSDFPAPAGEDEAAWREDVELLTATHRSLRDAVVALREDELAEFRGGRSDDVFALISGAAAHDLYHAGQIQLLKRMGAQRR